MNIIKKASAILPTIYGIFNIKVYTAAKLEHVALLKGKNFKNPVLVRIHSRCLTGDVFSSLKCDCHEQLQESFTRIGRVKNGALIYLNQEGRGIGLVNKIKAYALQETGLDTIQANEQLGFTADPRSYKIAARILKDLGINEINLLTNNPDKAKQLKLYGIKVIKCIPLEIPPNKFSKNYLKTKKNKLGHKLKLV